jgi:rsbT co-antagonist protein RsbR
MNQSNLLFRDFLSEEDELLTNNILRSINQIQPEAFIKLTNQTKPHIYVEQIKQLIHLLGKYAAGERTAEEIEQWGKQVSEDKVRLGLSLYESLQHFTIIRDVLWEALEELAKNHENLSAKQTLTFGKIINKFTDRLVLIFTNSYTGLTNKRLRAQQEVIDELSTPVISIVDGVAVLPIIGDIDTHRAKILMEHTLRETNRQEVDCLIMDFSGVFIVDTMVAQELFKIIDSLKLTGVDVNLTGMRPELAHSVVTLGINFDNVKMYNNLGQALKAFGIVRN